MRRRFCISIQEKFVKIHIIKLYFRKVCDIIIIKFIFKIQVIKIMNITFLIGNGFDIKLGLKTRYTDFYPTYIDSNKDRSKDDSIKQFSDLIKPNYETWADFEMAFAENAFGTKNDVRDILYDFSVKFADYLIKQTKLCDYADIALSKNFEDFLIDGYKALEEPDRQTIKNTYNSFKEHRTINFVNFNYTETLDNLIKISQTQHGSNELQSFRIGNLIFSTNIGQIINIHGHLNSSIILGIDSIEQIKNNDLKNNTTISKYCVKSSMNEDIGNKRAESNFINIIRSSKIIYSYGISFGDSDKSRWKVIAEWLKSDKSNKLIIYKYKTGLKNYNRIYMRMLLDAVEDIKDYYLKILGFDESEYESYHDQIFVIDSDDVLNFKLINYETTDEQEESLQVCTA